MPLYAKQTVRHANEQNCKNLWAVTVMELGMTPVGASIIALVHLTQGALVFAQTRSTGT